MTSKRELPVQIKRVAILTLRGYCRKRIPSRLRKKLRIEYEIKGTSVILVECRPSHEDPADQWSRMAFAEVRYAPSKKVWTLFCADRNGKWHRYKSQEPNTSLEALLMAIELDDTGIFFG